MEVRNNAEALKAFLGVPSATPTPTHPVRSGDGTAAHAAFAGDQATFSQAATEVSQATDEPAVRMDKVTAIQQVMASGSYSVPATEVAGKVMDAMLGVGLGSDN